MPNQTGKSASVNKGMISVLKKKVAWLVLCLFIKMHYIIDFERLSLVLVFLTSSFQNTNSQWTPSYLLAKDYREEVSKYIVAGFWGGKKIL